jgi:hypothetical protein
MSCMWCSDGGYWECGEGPLCHPDPDVRPPIQWHFCDEVLIEEGKRYYVKCRPGCEASVDLDSSVSPPWVLDGDFVGGSKGPVGTYKVYCGSGRGHPCQVKLEPVS